MFGRDWQRNRLNVDNEFWQKAVMNSITSITQGLLILFGKWASILLLYFFQTHTSRVWVYLNFLIQNFFFHLTKFLAALDHLIYWTCDFFFILKKIYMFLHFHNFSMMIHMQENLTYKYFLKNIYFRKVFSIFILQGKHSEKPLAK